MSARANRCIAAAAFACFAAGVALFLRRAPLYITATAKRHEAFQQINFIPLSCAGGQRAANTAAVLRTRPSRGKI
jgi:hypothetical protein